MISNEVINTLETDGEIKSVADFRLTDSTMARVLFSLSDSMYQHKKRAPMREYSTNAADAMKEVGKTVSEIITTLPSYNNLTLKIRDFGKGLTETQIVDVYCVLGESTKRQSNDYNGVLGYGCKSGFAYAETFTVTSWTNGEKSVYQCIKGDKTKCHSAILLSRCPSDEATGIEICIPVKANDIWDFHREAVDLYKYWDVMPTIIDMNDTYKNLLNKFRNTTATLKGEGWEVRPKCECSAKGVAYMGWVPYPIDWTTMFNYMSLNSQTRVLFDLLRENDVTLFYKMGEIQFGDHREGLEYKDQTLIAVSNRIKEIFEKIKDVIQEKFNTPTNMWEAKKMYNSIFGTGIVEVEKGENEVGAEIERIKILDGNLSKLEISFQNAFSWNGIPLNSAGFKNINRFDNADTTKVHENNHMPISPVMITFRKKKQRAKVNRCKQDVNNSITASNRVAVVHNDLGILTGMSAIARYIIFGTGMNYTTVHILSFRDDNIKNLFNKEYGFETVPMIKLSEISADAKKWIASNKITRRYGSSGGGGGVRIMKYMDIETTSIKENDVPLRELEDINYYIDLGEGGCRYKGIQLQDNLGASVNPDDIMEHINTLTNELDLGIEQVYIINKQTAKAKWFNDAKESGDWINIWDYLKESLNQLNPIDFVNAEHYNSNKVLCKKTVRVLLPKITDPNSQMIKLINLVGNIDYSSISKASYAIRKLDMWYDFVKNVSITIDINPTITETKEFYPFLSWSELESGYYIEDSVDRIAKYINAMDLYVDLTTDKTAVTEKELIAA